MMKAKRRSERLEKKRRSEEKVVDLPICMIYDILSKLPAESVLTCKLVCKPWYDLTRESSLIRKQHEWSKEHEENRYLVQGHYTSSNLLSLLDINENTIRTIPFNKMKLPTPTYPNEYQLSTYAIVCSCNGLLCLRSKAKVDNVVICNPITKDCLILPSSTDAKFMPWKSYQLGFHFDNSSRKYKVIREYRLFDNQPSQFQLITVGESSWKDLSPPNYIVEQGFDAAIFWNEGFHWKLSEIANGYGSNCILSFDLTQEKFFTISFPTDDNYPRHYRVTCLRGELKVVEHYRSRFLKIWKVTGNKVEGFSMFLQYTYIFCVPPSRMLQYEVISEIDEETYLMQVNAWTRGINKCRLEIFSPRTTPTRLQELHYKRLPKLFNIISFKPSLFSPFT